MFLFFIKIVIVLPFYVRSAHLKNVDHWFGYIFVLENWAYCKFFNPSDGPRGQWHQWYKPITKDLKVSCLRHDIDLTDALHPDTRAPLNIPWSEVFEVPFLPLAF